MLPLTIRTFAKGVPWNLFLLTVGCALFAFGVKAVAIPHTFISGGVFGTALLINYMTGTLSPAAWNVLLNVPIFIAGWLFVGRRFFFYSLYGLSVVSVATQWLDVTIQISDPILAAIAAGCLCGLGLGIVLHSIGCDGGLTIVSIALHQRYGIGVGQFSLLYNISLFVLAFSMYSPDNALYSLIMIFVYSKVMDYVSTIFNQRKLVLIISSQHEVIRKEILTTLHRGTTPRAAHRGAQLPDQDAGGTYFASRRARLRHHREHAQRTREGVFLRQKVRMNGVLAGELPFRLTWVSGLLSEKEPRRNGATPSNPGEPPCPKNSKCA